MHNSLTQRQMGCWLGNRLLEEGMTFAVEPKIVFPGEGCVGLENTVVVIRDGYEMLTPLEQDIFQV